MNEVLQICTHGPRPREKTVLAMQLALTLGAGQSIGLLLLLLCG